MSPLRRYVRVAGAVGFAVAALGWAAPGALAQNRVYWANYNQGTIGFANADGSGGSGTVNIPVGHVMNPDGVAIDPAHGKIYWANHIANTIGVANLDGSDAGTINTNGATISSPFGVALDLAQGRIYWANSNATAPPGISWARLDGLGGGDLPTGNATITDPIGVTIDPVAGKIYWSNWGGDKISFAFVDGSGGGDLSTTGATVTSPEGVGIDPNTQRLYFADQGGSAISYANLSQTGGGNLNTTGATVATPSGVAIDPFTNRIYWANQGGGRISSVSLSNGGSAGMDLNNSTTGNANLPVLLEVPRGTGAPAVSGGTTTPTTLSCSPGSWMADLNAQQLYDAPQSFAYSWTLDGGSISGATGNSITASTPGTYACTVTATNVAGSTSQTSAGFAVAAPPPPPPPPPPAPLPGPATPALHASTTGASATLTFSCAGVAGQICAGGFTFTAHEKTLQGRVVAVMASKHKGKKPKPKVVAVTLGTGSYTVPAGGKQTVKFTLNAVGRRLLAQFYALPATVTFSAVGGQTPPTQTVRFSYGRISAPVAFNFFFHPTFTMVATLSVSGAPRLGKVTAVCQGGGCPFGRKVFAHKSHVNLATAFGSAHLSPGTKITVEITAPNKVGSVNVFTMHAGAAPTEAHLCQPPGSAPAKCAP